MSGAAVNGTSEAGRPFNPYGLHSVHIPLGLLTHPSVSWGAKALYARLALYFGKPKERRKDGLEPICNPSLEKMAEAMHISEDTADRFLAELIEAGFIQRVRRRRKEAECVFLAHPSLVDSSAGPGGNAAGGRGLDSAELRNQEAAQDSAD